MTSQICNPIPIHSIQDTFPVTISKQFNIVTPEQYTTDLDKPVLTSLSNLSCYEVSGEDATDFLQGQFSNDINDVSEENAQLTSYSTPKGRMLAIFFICKRADNYLLITSADIADEVIKRLQMYIMRSKVVISKIENNYLFGLSNDVTSLVLNAIDITPPENDYQSSNNKETICVNIPGTQSRFLIIGNDDLVEKIQSLDTKQLYYFNHEYWLWLDVLAGLPMLTANTQESFVPQMTNMELINGVSFSKGCYPGQEIVARLHYLGNANRRMFRVEFESEQEVNAGDSIYSSDSNQEIGKLLSTVEVSEHKYTGLAVLRIEAAKNQTLSLSKDKQEIINIMDLPYNVPTEAKEKT